MTGLDRARRARRAARIDGPPSARPRLRAAVRWRDGPRQARHAPDLLEPGLRRARRAARGTRRPAVRRRARPTASWPARDDRHGARRPAVRGPPRHRWPIWPRSPASCSDRRSSAPATHAAATTVAFPGSARACCPASGRSTRSTGVSVSRSATPRSRTGPARRTRPATFGHFGGSGTFLWVDPPLDRALVCLTDRDFGPWALEAWPAFSDDVISTAPVAYSP